MDVNLVFDNRTGDLTRVWGYQSGGRDGVAEVLPQSGDLFQLYTLYLEADQTVSREPGPELFFDAANALYFDRRPLPNGGYSFGFSVQNVGGETAVSTLTSAPFSRAASASAADNCPIPPTTVRWRKKPFRC